LIGQINKIFPQVRQLHSDVHENSGDSDAILSQLNEMMDRYGTGHWSKLLRLLQLEINRSNRPMQMGLRSSKLMDIIYEVRTFILQAMYPRFF
jgi:hypothetical protein